jgi:hypothetical protein
MTLIVALTDTEFFSFSGKICSPAMCSM